MFIVGHFRMKSCQAKGSSLTFKPSLLRETATLFINNQKITSKIRKYFKPLSSNIEVIIYDVSFCIKIFMPHIFWNFMSFSKSSNDCSFVQVTSSQLNVMKLNEVTQSAFLEFLSLKKQWLLVQFDILESKGKIIYKEIVQKSN